MFKFLVALFPLVVCRVYAFPLSRTSTSKTYYIPLIVLSVFLFFLLLAIKLVYMKQRRIGTIHAPPVPFSSSTSLRDKETHRDRGLVVGCLGSPAWETNLTARLNGTAWRRRSSFARRDTLSTMRSTRSCTLDAHQFVLPSGTNRSRSLGSGRRNASARFRCGDFGEPRPGNSVAKSTRRASPSSIRLVDGPSLSGQVEYAFLSGLPPTAVLASPLTGTRDSFQLSRCSLKCDRKPVPPLPPLPSFLALHSPKDEEAQSREDGYLPELLFSPLVNVAGVFQQARNRSPEAKGTTPLRLVRQTKPVTNEAATDKCDAKELAQMGGKPLKSCLRQNSVYTSRTSTETGTLVDATSPISDDDLGMLGLDRFQWNDDIKKRSNHMKKDSIAWVPYWE